AGGAQVLLVTMHHIVSDGWSMELLVREGGAQDGAAEELAPLAVQYGDFAVWQQRWLAGERLVAEVGYWKEALAGASPLELPTDRPRGAERGTAGGRVPVALGRPLVEGIEALGRRHGATLFMTVLAGFQVLLHRYSGQREVCVGTPVA